MATRKRCSKCKEELLTECFQKDSTKVDGLYSSCRECRRKHYAVFGGEVKKQWYSKNKEIIRKKAREVYVNNREKELKRIQEYHNSHKEEQRIYNKNYARENYYSDIKYRISRSVRTKIVRTLKQGRKGRQRWESLVGYSLEDLRVRLEALFKNGMSWENYGKWHIDHIKPISSYQYKDYTDNSFKECWKLENLQPLWAFDNINKGGKSVSI